MVHQPQAFALYIRGWENITGCGVIFYQQQGCRACCVHKVWHNKRLKVKGVYEISPQSVEQAIYLGIYGRIFLKFLQIAQNSAWTQAVLAMLKNGKTQDVTCWLYNSFLYANIPLFKVVRGSEITQIEHTVEHTNRTNTLVLHMVARQISSIYGLIVMLVADITHLR